LIKDFSDWEGEPLIDPKTGHNYALSDDLAVLAIESPLTESVEMEIGDNLLPNSPIYITGYPGYLPTRPIVLHV
jgi:hypothetical protein